MPKLSDLDKAIAELETQREVIDAALAVLTNLRVKAPRRPRVVKKAEEKTA